MISTSLRELGLPAEYSTHHYWVRREVSGDDSIVDVEIASRGQFLIHIENKIRSSEGEDQTDREWSDVSRRAATIGTERVCYAACDASSRCRPPRPLSMKCCVTQSPLEWTRSYTIDNDLGAAITEGGSALR